MNLADINVNELKFGSLYTVPVARTWDDSGDDPDEPEWSYIEAICHTDPVYDTQRILIVRDGTVTHLWDACHDKAYARHEEESYLDDHWVYDEDDEDDEDDGGPAASGLEAEDFRRFLDVEPEGPDGPRMSYWYPVDYIDSDNAERIAVTLVDLPLCLVEVDGDWGLALTGGGMDMSWEIITAYVLIGLMPPVHFARDLPAMARRGTGADDQILIAACLRSLHEAADQMTRAAAQVAERFNVPNLTRAAE